MSHIETYINYLVSQKTKMADTLLVDYVHAVNHVINVYIQRKLIGRIQEDKNNLSANTQFKVNPNKRPVMEYYKNNSIAVFIPAALTALTILEQDSFQFSAPSLQPGYLFLQDLFEKEFFNYVDSSPEYHVRKSIKAFIDDAILMPHPTLPDTYNVTSSGFRKLKLFAMFLTTYFESYLVVLNFFSRYPKNFIDSKERLKKIQSIGNRMYKRKLIKLKEALSKINYKNGVDFFISKGIKGSNDDEKIKYYSDKINRYIDCI